MPGSSPLWISEADVVAMMDIREAIDVLERGLLAEANNEAVNMVKTHVEWRVDSSDEWGGGSTLHAIGAVFPQAGFAGTKTWTHTPGGATPILILFDVATGALKAIVEAFALGQMRTGGASGVATRWLAAEDAGELAMLGTGKQAITQVAAVLAVRPVRRVRVYGRNEERRNQFAKRVEAEFGVEAVASSTIGEALKDAPIVTVATRATEPIVTAEMCAPGTHINAMGSNWTNKRELPTDLVMDIADIVAVDSVEDAYLESGDLVIPLQERPDAKFTAVELHSARRTSPEQITIFKSNGLAAQDVAAAGYIYEVLYS